MRGNWLTNLAGSAAGAFLLALLLVPLATILWRSLAPADGTGMAGFGAPFVSILRDPYYLGRVGFTLWQALLSTILTVAVGLPTALLLARYAFRGRNALMAVFTIPFVMPTVVAGIGFLALVGPRGVVGVDLQGTLAAVLLAHVFFNFAVVARLVASFVEGLAPRLEQAAATLGAGPWRAMLRVTLPLALPATLAAAVLVFIFCFTSFGVILILAPSAQLATLEVEIYRLTSRLLSLDAAAVLALVQLVVVGVLSHVYTRLQARLAVSVPLGGRGVLRRPSRAAGALLIGDLVVVFALVLAPLGALVIRALTAPSGAFPSLANFSAMIAAPASFGYASLGAATLNSLKFASLSTLLALVIGFAFAYSVARGGWRWLDQASLLPLAVSPVTLAFGYLLSYPVLVTTTWGVPLAHALIAFPFVTRSLLPALRAQPRALTAAAASLGAGPWRTLTRVELPLLKPALLTAAAFAFAISLGEFGASLLLTRHENATLPVAIYTLLGRVGPANFGAALALAVVLMLLTTAVMLLLSRRERSEF
ncbi:MAG: iron ABC transporter permease [Trueperaceae bacterium]|nr:iron ABC transporter permease [Trueperaceae bacterium]